MFSGFFVETSAEKPVTTSSPSARPEMIPVLSPLVLPVTTWIGEMVSPFLTQSVLVESLLAGIPVTLLQLTAILLWIFKGIWWLFPVWVIAGTVYGICASRYYFWNVSYICPQCHETFRPALKEAFWARHTPKTRKLTCVKCGYHGFCVEVWGRKMR